MIRQHALAMHRAQHRIEYVDRVARQHCVGEAYEGFHSSVELSKDMQEKVRLVSSRISMPRCMSLTLSNISQSALYDQPVPIYLKMLCPLDGLMVLFREIPIHYEFNNDKGM